MRVPARGRRWLIGMEPIFEGGWLHRGRRGRAWDVEPRIGALALLGDVTIDLRDTKSTPEVIVIDAHAVLRDVDILVAPGDRVEVTDRGRDGHLTNSAPPVSVEASTRVIQVIGHAAFGDVNVRAAG